MNPKVSVPRSATTFAPGELVLGRFRIVRLLGSGGMGEVYEATDLELGRIALKTLRADFGSSAEALARFKKEVQLARKVGGQHICRVHELFVTPGVLAGIPSVFLTMEYLEGATLADRIAASGPMTWKEAQAIGLEICAGLETIHRAGIIHRDLKSRNVMLASRNGATCAVLMDFGLAREFASAATAETSTFATRPGGIVGTPAYMAPEQFEGAEVTPATDVYALGIVLYEMVTGKHPFAATSTVEAAVLRGRRPQAASAVQPGVPRQCDEVIRKCLEYEAGTRYQSAKQVAGALGAYPLTAGRLAGRPLVGDQKWGILAGVCGILLLLAVGGILWFRAHRYYAPAADVRKWYDMGLADLREGTYGKAKNELQMAVKRDEKFALADARLAEAWNELDYQGEAQRQMLYVDDEEAQKTLSSLDRMYVEAVRYTLRREFDAALKRYQEILEELPERQKAYGYVDLGRAEEKAGNVKEALKDYEEATKRDSDNPAAFVRLGVLRNRQWDVSGGAADFQKAEMLYRAKGNPEGVAEVAYQRGYTANERGASGAALTNLQSALKLADGIPSVQLHIRCLSQLSSVEASSGHGQEAEKYANQEIELARVNNLDYWALDGQFRLGSAYLSRGEYDKAESTLQSTLRQAQQNSHPRVEANAKFTLASVRDRQHKWNQSIELSRAALDYYKGAGMIDEATEAAMLVARSQARGKNYSAALQSATELLDASNRSGSDALLEKSEELMGEVLYGMERYPEALFHYKEGLRFAREMKENESLHALECADILWQLGKYEEAQAIISEAQSGKDADDAAWAELMNTNMLLSERRFTEVVAAADKTLGRKGFDADSDDGRQFKLLRTRAELGMGQLNKASKDIAELTARAKKKPDSDAETPYYTDLVQAEVYRRMGPPKLAEPLADKAYGYFLGLGKKESQWLSLLERARVEKSLGNARNCEESAKLALDILKAFEETWPSPDYRTYTTRPDIKAALQELASYE